jgi:predicted Zn-dependent protease
MEMKFSQKQEKDADLFALNLLYQKYNHVSGAIEFLEKIEGKRKVPKFFYFFATHPHPKNRIKVLKEKIAKENYPANEAIPLDIN